MVVLSILRTVLRDTLQSFAVWRMDALPSRAANRIFLIVSTINISFNSSPTRIRQTASLNVGHFCTPNYRPALIGAEAQGQPVAGRGRRDRVRLPFALVDAHTL
jgi:hypothetical protein